GVLFRSSGSASVAACAVCVSWASSSCCSWSGSVACGSGSLGSAEASAGVDSVASLDCSEESGVGSEVSRSGSAPGDAESSDAAPAARPEFSRSGSAPVDAESSDASPAARSEFSRSGSPPVDAESSDASLTAVSGTSCSRSRSLGAGSSAESLAAASDAPCSGSASPSSESSAASVAIGTAAVLAGCASVAAARARCAPSGSASTAAAGSCSPASSGPSAGGTTSSGSSTGHACSPSTWSLASFRSTVGVAACSSFTSSRFSTGSGSCTATAASRRRPRHRKALIARTSPQPSGPSSQADTLRADSTDRSPPPGCRNPHHRGSFVFVVRQGDHQHRPADEHPTVDAEHLAPGVQQRLGDLLRRHTHLVGDHAVPVHDARAAQPLQHQVGDLGSVRPAERVPRGHATPDLPPLGQVVIGEDLPHRVVDRLLVVAPLQVLRGVGVHQQVILGVRDDRPGGQPLQVPVGQTLDVVGTAAVEQPAPRETAHTEIRRHGGVTERVHTQHEDLVVAEQR